MKYILLLIFFIASCSSVQDCEIEKTPKFKLETTRYAHVSKRKDSGD